MRTCEFSNCSESLEGKHGKRKYCDYHNTSVKQNNLISPSQIENATGYEKVLLQIKNYSKTPFENFELYLTWTNLCREAAEKRNTESMAEYLDNSITFEDVLEKAGKGDGQTRKANQE